MSLAWSYRRPRHHAHHNPHNASPPFRSPPSYSLLGSPTSPAISLRDAVSRSRSFFRISRQHPFSLWSSHPPSCRLLICICAPPVVMPIVDVCFPPYGICQKVHWGGIDPPLCFLLPLFSFLFHDATLDKNPSPHGQTLSRSAGSWTTSPVSSCRALPNGASIHRTALRQPRWTLPCFLTRIC